MVLYLGVGSFEFTVIFVVVVFVVGEGIFFIVILVFF